MNTVNTAPGKEVKLPVQAYIQAQDKDRQEDLNLECSLLKEVLPKAEERISWRIPAFWNGRSIIHFAAFKKHIVLSPGPDAMLHFPSP